MKINKLIPSALSFASIACFAQTGPSGFDGTGTAGPYATQLASHFCKNIVFQNDASSTTSVKVGYSNIPALTLAPGASITLIVFNSSDIYYKSVSGNPIYNWGCK